MEREFSLTYLDSIKSKEIKWLWYPYIPYGKITIVQGDPGDGKTTFILSIIAGLTKNACLPCSSNRLLCNTIYQNTEDDIADTIKPRLEKHLADCKKVCFINKSEQLLLDDDCLEKAITESGAELLVLDPLQSFVGENVDMNRANSIRPRLSKLKNVAEKTGCAIVIIGHLNKKAGGKLDYRGLGSIDIQAAARSVLLIGKHEDYPNYRFVAQQKNNLAPLGQTLGFTLVDGVVRWLGPFPISAEELSTGESDKRKSKERVAIKIIANLLVYGRKPSELIFKHCADEGISERTVNNAKKKLNIKAIRQNNAWYWELVPCLDKEQ